MSDSTEPPVLASTTPDLSRRLPALILMYSHSSARTHAFQARWVTPRTARREQLHPISLATIQHGAMQLQAAWCNAARQHCACGEACLVSCPAQADSC
eukprot:135345-Chlamydomonas_euryale.AAC.1